MTTPPDALALTFHGVIYSKKNSKRLVRNRATGRPMLISSKRAIQNEEDMVWQFSTLRTATLCFPLRVEIDIWQPDRRRRDLDNQATSILDALVRAGIIQDDSTKIVHELEVKLAGIDKTDPRAVIRINRVEIADGAF